MRSSAAGRSSSSETLPQTVCDNSGVSWRTIRETFWSVDALLFVVIFNALLLLVPRMKTRLPVSGR